MRRVAFKMKLFKGCCEEYKKRHDCRCCLSPVLEISDTAFIIQMLERNCGLSFLPLFAVQKLTDANSADSLPEKEIMKKWWDHMADIMETKPDQSPVCTELREVFYLN